MTQKAARNVLDNIDLLVCDMAGTAMQEGGGLVYQVLQRSMTENGLKVSDHDMEAWHGAKTETVIEHFARQSGIPDKELEETVLKISDLFVNSIDKAYFDETSTISPIDASLLGRAWASAWAWVWACAWAWALQATAESWHQGSERR